MRLELHHRKTLFPRVTRRGHALVELALLAPWLFFLLAGAVDFGFYSHALIGTQNAARVAALYTSSSGSSSVATACSYAVEELRANPNMSSPCSCAGSTCTAGSAFTMTVTAVPKESAPGYDPTHPERTSAASRVSVTYRTITLIPIPGLLPGQLTITRAVTMSVRS